MKQRLSRVFGKRLVRVQYRHSGEDALRECVPDQVHEVDAEVALVFENAETLDITWAMEGPFQGLAVESLAGAEGWPRMRLSWDDMTDTPEWKRLIGHRLERVGAAWHESEDGAEDALWALRLSFGDAGSAVVALGQVREGQVGYMPDELIVIFDEDVARSYASPAGYSDSFGETLLD